jgi:uncharacterized protein (TIGR02145 family)
MKIPSNLIVSSLFLLAFILGCSKDDNSELAKEIVENLVVGNSQFIEGSIPDEGIEYSPFDVDSIIEISNNRGAFTLKTRADKPVSLLLIQFEGIDGYFQVVYDKDGDFVFAKKGDVEVIHERVANLGLILWSTGKLPKYIDLQAKIVGVVGYKPGNFPPTRTELQGFLDENLFGHLSAIRNIRFLFPSFECGVSTVRDFDGNIYNTVKIGTQCWTKENLKTTHYNDSKPLRYVSSNSEWSSLRSGAWSFYNNDTSNIGLYGKLYNWYAINKSNLCPKGWHIPTQSEWEILKSYLGGASVAGGKIKSTGTIEAGTGLWSPFNVGATNSSGFTGHPAGGRDFNGLFNDNIGKFGYWWTSTSVSSDEAHAYYVLGGNAELYDYSYLKTLGKSCRCVKD